MAGRFTSATELTLDAHDRLDRLRASDSPAARDAVPDLIRLLKNAAYPAAKSFANSDDSPEFAGGRVNWSEMSEQSPGYEYQFKVLQPSGKIWNGLGCTAAIIPVGLVTMLIWEKSEGWIAPLLSLLLAPIACLLIFAAPIMTAGVLAEHLLRLLFAGRGPQKREEETAADSFAGFFTPPFLFAGILTFALAISILGHDPALPKWTVIGISVGVAFCVAAAAGMCVGGYYAARELAMHGRRRAMLRDAIRHANRVLRETGSVPADPEEGPTAGDANAVEPPNTEPQTSASQPRSGPLPPHVVALAQLCGYVAKRDGRVTPSEVASAEMFIEAANFDEAGREAYIRAFDEGKSLSRVGFQIGVLKAHCGNDADLKQQLFEIVVRIAHADGHVSPEEAEVLEQVNRDLCDNLLDVPTLVETLNKNDPYAVLGLTPPCTREQARKAYRKKAAEFHPDSLRHQKIPDEMRVFAEQRYRNVQEAWDRIEGDLG